MNDDFLLRLRERPPPEFARQLKVRLDAQDAPRSTLRSRYLRGFGIALLLGGAAYAIGTGALKMLGSARMEPSAAGATPAGPVTAENAGLPLSPLPLPAAADTAIPAETPARTLESTADARRAGGLPSGDTAAPQAPTGSAALGGPRRDTLTIVGTPGTEPHTASVLQHFERTHRPQPSVQLVPASEAVARICEVAGGRIDVVVTFNRIAETALQSCAAAQSTFVRSPERIIELAVGYDAAIVARSVLYGRAELSARTVFLALARDVPDPQGSGELVANPYRAWYEIDPQLPYYIAVSGPPHDSPGAHALLELVMRPGCAAVTSLAALARTEPERAAETCEALREDGLYTEYAAAGAAVPLLETDSALFGVLGGYDFMQNRDKLAAAAFDGVVPSLETLANGTYPASRTLYVYAGRGGGRPDYAELVEVYARLPETARVLIAPDREMRREMWKRTGLFSRTGLMGDIR